MSRNLALAASLLSMPLAGCSGSLLIGAEAGGEGGGEECFDVDEDGVTTCDDDCDDEDPANFPGNEEACDGLDNDCDGEADAGPIDFLAKSTLENEVLVFHMEDGDLVGPTEVGPDGGGTTYAAVVADFDGDGLLDMIGQRFESFPDTDTLVMDYYTGGCEGALEHTGSPDGLVLEGSVDIHTAGDVDGDGDVDVIGWDYVDGFGVVWLNDGSGSFSNARVEWSLRWWDPFNENRREVVAMPFVDEDLDGDLDFLECTNLAGQQSRCEYKRGDGSGRFEAVTDWVMDGLINGLAFADFDGDGDNDILGGLDDDGDAGQVWMWQQEDDQILPRQEAFDVNPADENSSNAPGYGWMYPVDMDADGDLDVVTVTMSPFLEGPMDLHVVRNNGDGTFATPELFGNSLHPLVDFGMFTQDDLAVPVHAFTD